MHSAPATMLPSVTAGAGGWVGQGYTNEDKASGGCWAWTREHKDLAHSRRSLHSSHDIVQSPNLITRDEVVEDELLPGHARHTRDHAQGHKHLHMEGGRGLSRHSV